MKKTFYIIVVAIVIIGIVVFVSGRNKFQNTAQAPGDQLTGFDGRNSSFVIDGQSVSLVNGVAEAAQAPGSASKSIVRYFGNEATGDLTGDGLPDTAFLVSQNTGGSGNFFYAVVAVKTSQGYKTTNAFFIGDRIAPQSTVIHSDALQLDINYAERKPGEPMTAQPSLGAVKVLKVTKDGVLEGYLK